MISIFPCVTFPAFDAGEDVMSAAIGGGVSFGFNFLKKRVVGLGFDFSASFGLPADEGSGYWVGTSIGLPLRLGSRGPSLVIRPGLNLDVLEYSVGDAYSSVEADWFSQIGGDLALGASLLVAFELNLHRFGFGFFGAFEYLFVPHSGTEFSYGAYSGDLAGRYTVQAGIRFMIRI